MLASAYTDLGEQAPATAVFEAEALAASEFCGGSGIDGRGPDVPPSVVVVFAVPCDLIGAKVIREVYI